jgi:hypothetical protein
MVKDHSKTKHKLCPENDYLNTGQYSPDCTLTPIEWKVRWINWWMDGGN